MDAIRIEAWVNHKVTFCLRHWVAIASLWCALVVAGAAAIPLLKAGGFETLSWLGYTVYRVICPQQPDHSWFIAGEKMGFEQRDTAMFLAGALAGPLYLLVKRWGFRQLNGRVVLLLQIPILFDVFSQVVGLRDSDGLWRTLTGVLSVLAIAGWLYPQIDADFKKMVQRYEETGYAPERAPAPDVREGETWSSRTSSASGR